MNDPVATRILASFARRRWGYLLGASFVAMALVPPLLSRTIPDTSWLLYVAGRLLDGERLYVDLVEANPPLIVWLNLPAAAVSRFLGVADQHVYHAMVLALAAVSLLAVRALLRRLLPGQTELRRYLTLAAVFVLLPLARTNFGEREHLMLLLVMPYIALAAVRVSRQPVPALLAAAIGACAGLGISLKPYFVLPWLVVEGSVWLMGGKGRWLPRPETLGVVTVGLLYLAAVWVLAPEYRTLAPMMAGTYYDYLRNHLAITALVGEGAAPTLAALLSAIALRQAAVHRSLWAVVAAAAGGFYLTAVLQHKGWAYHYYPAFACGMLVFAIVAVDLRRPLHTIGQRIFAAVAQAVVLALPLVIAIAAVEQALDPFDPRYEPDPDFPGLLPLVSERAAGRSVMVLSWSAASAFPLLPAAGSSSASRFTCLWMVGGLYGERAARAEPLRYREVSEMGRLERYMNRSVAEDLGRRRAALLLALAPAPDDPEWGLRRVDLLAYFMRDPGFADAFTRYRFLGRVGQYWAFERLPEDAAPARARSRESRWDPSEVAAVLAEKSARRLDLEALIKLLLFLLAFAYVWKRGRVASPLRPHGGSEAA